VWIFVSAAVVSFAICPLAVKLARRFGALSVPVDDRWHRQPTPLYGGIGIAAGTLAGAFAVGVWDRTSAALVGSAMAVLVLGLVDDAVKLGATAKLVGSLAIGAALVYFLTDPGGPVPSAPAILLAVLWFAGIAHSFNLLDNMDGLAGGVGAIIAVGAGVVLLQADRAVPAMLLVALGGALIGFLPWNTHPARMFMGDGGSLFIGSVLAGASLTLWFGPYTSAAEWSLPILVVFIVPIAETIFVSSLRWMAGRNPTRGGIDHPSHRLVAMGFSERRTVLFLYAVTLASVAVAASTAQSGVTALSAAIALAVGVLLGAIHLARVPTYQGDDFAALQRVPYRAMLTSAFLRSHAVQVLLDLLLISAAYYAAYRLRFEGEGLEIFLPSFTASLPIVLICKPLTHYVAGLYGRSWATFGVGDLAAVLRAVVLGSTASVLAVTYLYRFERFSRGVFIIDAALLLLAILGTRLSFRLMAHAAVMQSTRAKRVLICGAGERGRLLVREMLANPHWHLKPVGFVDGGDTADPSILGVRVAGTVDQLEAVLDRLRVEEVVFSGDALDLFQRQRAVQACAAAGVSVRELIFEIREPTVKFPGSSVA
jgi:UDP-GlcNAc:undecaprenyl-phosphate GlcNAc-1-phosphate transferase